MKKFLKIFLGILFLALLVGTFVFLWNKTRPVKVVYTLATPVHDTIRQYVIASGKVEPRDEVLIKPQISGIISEVLCKAGDRVKQGDVIATVKVIPEMGTLNAAESRVTVARLSLDQTRKEFERTEALYAKGVVSQEEFEKGQTTLRQAEEELQNAEGNLGIANAILEHLAVKLPVSRLQRDLTDSTVLRNVGVPFGHIIIAIQSSLKGLRKLLLNETAIYRDLDNCWSVVAEAIQTILRREAYPHPYEALKALTRTNQAITENSIKEFIEELNVSEDIKKELRAITPHTYTGL